MSDICNLADATSMIRSIGEMTQTEAKASQIQLQIEKAFSNLPLTTSYSVLYLIWKDPWMAAGKNTFIDSMLQKIGWSNVISESRYPELNTTTIQALSPEVILLPSEPFPFTEQNRHQLLSIAPLAKIILVDGEMFSWYGSRLVKSPEYFQEIVTGDII
jgi:ABC-type Fe3+-hydroxamate transport system substrate-binding protein